MDFEEFMRSNQRSLLRLAAALSGNAGLAEDIVANVLGRAYERWDRIGSVVLPEAYVRRMVVNEFLSHKRREKRHTFFPGDDELAWASPDPAAAHAERAELQSRLARLPAKQRAAIVLRYYAGLPDQEIASALGCAQGTVRSLVSRALATLRIQPTPEEPSETSREPRRQRTERAI